MKIIKNILSWIVIILVFFIAQLIISMMNSKENDNILIESYHSQQDKDKDGIDDQIDILNNAKDYIKTKPKYKSKYYETGYPNDQYGVCTDVVAIAMKEAGYDLMELVYEDILNHKEDYKIEVIDKNIDFRRVKNLKIYFKNNAISLTNNINEIAKWQGGDIVIFEKHIGIISDKRDSQGIPYVIHHANPYQTKYEESILKKYKIVGHYRIS